MPVSIFRCFILYAAVSKLFPDTTLKIDYSVGKGFFFEIEGIDPQQDLSKTIKEEMERLIRLDLPILKEKLYAEDAMKVFAEEKLDDKLSLLGSKRRLYYSVNTMGPWYGYFYGILAPSTGYISLFDIDKYFNGYTLVMPRRNDPSQLEPHHRSLRIYDVFAQHKRWMSSLHIHNIGTLNHEMEKRGAELVKIGEALQEKLFSNLSDTIYDKFNQGAKVVLISGPSSSGKTTFSFRLDIQLKVYGFQPVILSMDNYFVNREETPLDEEGHPDFESIKAVDTALFNEQLNQLIAGEEIEIPKFDFHEGKRYYDGTKMRLEPNSIIMVEGIHALNPELTDRVPDDKKFRIYVSALTSLSMDNTSYISTTDNRLLRRIVRDAQFRNRDAATTIQGWLSVRRGEEKNIFPYQDGADYQFNSSLFFEIGVLKPFVAPLLLGVPNTSEAFAEARRLLLMLDYFKSIDARLVPSNSIIREFIGNSDFNY